LPLPGVFYNQFIDSPVFITGKKIHGNNKKKRKKRKEKVLDPCRKVKATPTDNHRATIVKYFSFTYNCKLQLETKFPLNQEKKNKKNRNYELRTLPSIRQVAANGEGYLPLPKLLHCNLKRLDK
jgi:hypothetical protein